jgi:hypothetical protein
MATAVTMAAMKKPANPRRKQRTETPYLQPDVSTLEACRRTTKERLIDPFERVDAVPPCLVQKEQLQARAGISAGSGSQVREKEMFLQWHLPWINKRAIFVVCGA